MYNVYILYILYVYISPFWGTFWWNQTMGLWFLDSHLRAGIKMDESRSWILWSTFWHVVRRFFRIRDAENKAGTMACTACVFIRGAGHLSKHKYGFLGSGSLPSRHSHLVEPPSGLANHRSKDLLWRGRTVDCIHQRYKSSAPQQIQATTLRHQKTCRDK